ncbi:MAG: hypothetical protein IKN42_07605, partial [Elusimicrobia bacterium]|nr:hypothetical protein [Elusimicrobiota bacterium]
FYADISSKEMRFDVVMSFEIDPKEGLATINKEVTKLYPDYKIKKREETSSRFLHSLYIVFSILYYIPQPSHLAIL